MPQLCAFYITAQDLAACQTIAHNRATTMLVFTLEDEELRRSADGGLKTCADTSQFLPFAAFLCRLSNVYYSLCLFHVKRLWLVVNQRHCPQYVQ